MDVIIFLRSRYAERRAQSQAARKVDPSPWGADVTDDAARNNGIRSSGGFGLVTAADGKALWDCEGSNGPCMTAASARHVAENDPAFVLADLDAKKHLLDEIERMTIRGAAGEAQVWWGERPTGRMLRALAAPFAWHRDYDPRWTLDT